MICVARMSGMRDLERLHRIVARSIPEVVGAMERTVTRHGESRAIRFRGRKLSAEAFINAALLHLLDLPEAEQDRALSTAIGRLESILADDSNGKGGGGDVMGQVVDDSTSRRKGRKGG